MTLDEVIGAYVELRDQRDAIKKRHTEELAKINGDLYKLQTWLHKQLQDTGQQSAKTPSGTAFLQTDTYVKVTDFEQTIAFIKSHELWDMLEKRVSKSVVTDFIESHQKIPPGLEISSEISCHIRRS